MVPIFKNGTLENPTIAAGHLGKVWLGGLVNPQALLVAIRQEKAIVAQCSMSEVKIIQRDEQCCKMNAYILHCEYFNQREEF